MQLLIHLISKLITAVDCSASPIHLNTVSHEHEDTNFHRRPRFPNWTNSFGWVGSPVSATGLALLDAGERYEDRNCAVAGPVKRPTPPAAARSWQRMYASRCPAGLHGVWVRGETYRVTRARDLCVSTRKEKKQNWRFYLLTLILNFQIGQCILKLSFLIKFIYRLILYTPIT